MENALTTKPCGVRLPGREQASALVQVDDAVVVGTQAGQLLLYRLLPSADGDPASPTCECWLEARLRLRPGVQVWPGCSLAQPSPYELRQLPRLASGKTVWPPTASKQPYNPAQPQSYSR